MAYEILVNVTNPVDIIKYPNVVTPEIGFWNVLFVVFWLIFYMSLNKFGADKAFASSSFVMGILGFLMWLMGLIGDTIFFIAVIAAALGAVSLYIGSRD